MGSPRKSYSEQVYGPERARTLRSRLFVLLRDELGLGRQPKVARLLVDEIQTVVDETMVDADVLRPGQVLVLAPEVGQGPSWQWRRLEDKRMKAVRLTLIDIEDIEQLAAGESLPKVRQQRLVRLVRECFAQGATLTSCQLSMMTGTSPSCVSSQLRKYMQQTGEILPTRGIVEDYSPAVTHKAQIIARHLQGESTAEIARATNHTPHAVERYIRRFEQIRELVRYLDRAPDPEVISRILGCSARLVSAYLDLMPSEELQAEPERHARTGT